MSYTSKQAAQESQRVDSSANKVVSPKFADQRASTSVQLKQQKMMNASDANPLQRAEDEELLQGKFEAAQLAGEEELLQGKFATAQLAEDEELLQGKFATAQLMEEEEPLQGKFEMAQLAGEEELLQGKFSNTAITQLEPKPNNTGLPDNLKSGVENLSGYSMDDVKVHYNSGKPSELQAHAYAQGTDIHVAPGQEQHLPHEAWHVVQQKQGRVQPTTQMKGTSVNDDVGLETEADVMGAKAMQLAPMKFLPADPLAQRMKISPAWAATAQLRRKFVEDAGRRHYWDGWGELYSIQDDATLKDEIQNEELGVWTRDIGDYYHAEEGVERPCTIGYRNRQGQREITTSIYHCGPSSQ